MTSTTTRSTPPGHPSATVSASPGRLRRGRLLVVAGLVALLALAALASLAVGAKPIPIDQVWDAIWAPTGTENDIVVRSLRAPRTVLGIGVGIALGLAGALMQGHTRNPLADPGILGVAAPAPPPSRSSCSATAMARSERRWPQSGY